MKNEVLGEKSDTGNPYVRFVEWNVTLSKPRRRPLLYKRVWMSMACVLMMASLFGSTVLSNVKMQQRYPWNGKIDISFNVNSTRTDLGLRLNALDTLTGQSYTVASLKNADGTVLNYPYHVSSGANRLVWDAGADLPVGLKSSAFTLSLTVGKVADHPLYAVIDLSEGAEASTWPVTYLTAVPDGGWSDDYKTTKMAFRFIPPGTFTEGPNDGVAFSDGKTRKCILTKPYYIGVFPVTQKQMRLIMGETYYVTWLDRTVKYNSANANKIHDKWPASAIPQVEIRGKYFTDYPTTTEVTADSLVGLLRAKTGFSGFDLPTEAQWEWACRGGTTTPYYTGDTTLTDDECKEKFGPQDWYDVGCYQPNPWGLYDMVNNMTERCAGFYETNWCDDPAIDPMGTTWATCANPKGYAFPIRAGGIVTDYRVNTRCWDDETESCWGCFRVGFRLVIQLD